MMNIENNFAERYEAVVVVKWGRLYGLPLDLDGNTKTTHPPKRDELRRRITPDMDLPNLGLGARPVRHGHCCLGLSTRLFEVLSSIFAKQPTHQHTILSIGSGTGLLEALLQKHLDDDSNEDESLRRLRVEGVEVQQDASAGPVNVYLPEYAINTVRGTWGVSPRLRDQDVLVILFVFPRQPSLVARHVQMIRQGELRARFVVWLGPVADWAEFATCFTEAGEGPADTLETRRGGEAGLEENEMMAAWRAADSTINTGG
jgi:hypothetical protein